MKTISELNSKWWWRLIKVIWILGFLFFAFVAIMVYSNFTEYNPNGIKEYNAIVSTECNRLDDIYPNIPKNKTFSRKEFINEYQKTQLTPYQTLLTIYATDNSVEGVSLCDDGYGGCEMKNESEVNDIIKNNPFQEFTINSYPIYEFTRSVKQQIETRVENRLKGKEICDSFAPLSQKNTRWDNEYFFESFYRKELPYIHHDYLPIAGWIYTILSYIGIIVGMLLFTFFARGTFYYIILGKFNPKK